MEKNKVKFLNKIYFIFLVIVLIITLIFSFNTGKRMYYLINTNLENEKTAVKTDIANWSFNVTITY